MRQEQVDQRTGTVLGERCCTHVMFGKLLDHDGADHATQSAEPVTDAHQDGGVARRDVQVINVEPWGRDGALGRWIVKGGSH